VVKRLFLIGLFYAIFGMVNVLAEDGELGDESWIVKSRVDRNFYFTHGSAVWGHEFGFFKDKNDCGVDTFWLSFSASEEKVKDFVGKDVEVSLKVDGKDFRVKVPMLGAHTLSVTQVMTFTNRTLDQALMEALKKGKFVEVAILEPKELEALLDIKEDRFSLEQFGSSQKQAMAACREDAQIEQIGASLVLKQK
jgi:hypothetical protein